MIRVVAMVEGSRLQVAGFRMLLRQVSSNISVLAVVRRFDELGHAIDGRAPDIAVLDVRTLDPALIQAVRRLRESAPSVKIMLVVDIIDSAGAREVMRLGVSGLFSSDADPHGLLRGLQAVSAGDVVISSTASGPLFREPTGPIPALTAHELRILRLVAKGLRNDEIARQLAISPSTLKRNLKPILSKLDATDRASALFAAAKAGLL
ncbi:LuxR C-terminal-related transcriptional regulator [Nonomuraea sp. NPDC050394]|uniref:LuxR C-terminal-related transcriptional regulator n=1 Tax=Nonomuraea sp. NPDC050394 TaxID=3364363 RepID=UPI0037AF40F2